MREDTELGDLISKVIDRHASAMDISPRWVATEVMVSLDPGRQSEPRVYLAAHLQFRQIASSPGGSQRVLSLKRSTTCSLTFSSATRLRARLVLIPSTGSSNALRSSTSHSTLLAFAARLLPSFGMPTPLKRGA